MPVTFENIFWDKILTPIRSDLRTEFGGSCKIYISDKYENNGNFSIRLFSESSSFEEARTNSQIREYNVDISYYLISADRSSDRLYEKIYRDTGRIEALLFSERFKNSASSTGFINGIIEDIVVNSKTDDELEIENLNTVKFSYTCQYEGNFS